MTQHRAPIETSPVPEDVRAEMVRLYVDEHRSLREIGRETFWSKSTVGRVILAHGIPLRTRGGANRPGLSDEDLDRTVELYQQGISSYEIAARLGLARSTVTRRLKVAGAHVRSRSEYIRLRRRAEVARGELTARQRGILGVLERPDVDGISCARIADRIRLDRHATFIALYELETFGLVKCVRSRPRPYLWRRTDLALVDVLWNAAMDRGPTGKPRAEDSLEIGPLRAWLARWVAEEDRRVRFLAVTGADPGTDGTGGLASTGEIVRALGIDDRRLYALRFEQEHVSLAVADGLLTKAGRGVTLGDLWPHLDGHLRVVCYAVVRGRAAAQGFVNYQIDAELAVAA